MLLYIAAGFLWLDGFYAYTRFNAIGLNVQGHAGLSEHIRQCAFIVEYALAICVLYSATWVRRPTAVALLVALCMLTCVDLAAHAVYGRPADLGNIAALNASLASLPFALREYGPAIATSLVACLAFYVSILLFALTRNRRSSATLPLLLLLILAAMYGYILVKRGPPALIGFPKGFAFGFGTVSLQVNDLLTPPAAVPVRRAAWQGHDFRNVIVVVDESVEYGRFADIFPAADSRYVDFGRAYSGANCSAASNYILRKAFWPRQTANRLDIRQTDSLFALAKRRGFRTLYIDNQQVLRDPTIRNYIDDKELASVDRVIENEQAAYVRDAAAVRQIAAASAQGKNFIFINKSGAHFPYRDNIPPQEVTGDRTGNYITAIRNNTVDFLLRLQASLPADSIVFYTSDHGQDLRARGPHCNTGSEASIPEYQVPFLVLATDPDTQAWLRQSAAISSGWLSHLEFSESVRNVLGYSTDGLDSVFRPPQARQAYCGLYGSPKPFFGMLPQCKSLIEPGPAAMGPGPGPAVPGH